MILLKNLDEQLHGDTLTKLDKQGTQQTELKC